MELTHSIALVSFYEKYEILNKPKQDLRVILLRYSSAGLKVQKGSWSRNTGMTKSTGALAGRE